MERMKPFEQDKLYYNILICGDYVFMRLEYWIHVLNFTSVPLLRGDLWNDDWKASRKRKRGY